MKISEAIIECERWLTYLDKQREKAEAIQKLASARRQGAMTLEEAQHQMRAIDGRASITVYDGAKLERAVRTVLHHIQKEHDNG